MFARIPPPDGKQKVALVACAAAGALGLLPGAAGALDPVTELAWLALLAPAAGAACGALRTRLVPFGLAVPGAWALLLVLSASGSDRDLATPLWAAVAVGGLFAAGHAFGLVSGRVALAAGALLLTGLLLGTAAIGFGLGSAGDFVAREHPRAARVLFELSPLTLAFDCAGWDWAHSQPDVYSRSGIEWFLRRPSRGHLAAPAVLVVGCALSWVVSSRAGARPDSR